MDQKVSVRRREGSGSAFCKLVEKNGCVTGWSAGWHVPDGPVSDGESSDILSVSGCGDEFDIHLEATQTGMRITIPDLKASCQLGKPEEIDSNVRILKSVIGERNALTACNCIDAFARETGWRGKM